MTEDRRGKITLASRVVLFLVVMVAVILLDRYEESVDHPWPKLLLDSLFGAFLLSYGIVSAFGVLVPRLGRIVHGEYWPGRFVDPRQRRLATRVVVIRSTMSLMVGDGLVLGRLYPEWWSMLLGLSLFIGGAFVGLHAWPLMHELRRNKAQARASRQL